MNFPMPNDKLDNGIVIASQYLDDETAEVVLLESAPPFYRRTQIALDMDVVDTGAHFENISDALVDWQ